MIIIVVISTVQYFTDTGEHAPLYKINNNVYIKPEKQYIKTILYSLHTTPAHTRMNAQKKCNGKWGGGKRKKTQSEITCGIV